MLAVQGCAAARLRLSSLRLCVSAGESLPADIFLRWKDRFGIEIIDGIGTTEILHMFISNRPGQVQPGSSGKPVPGYEAAIVDEHGAPVVPGEIGNLRIKGDSIMAGYWNQPEKTKATLHGDWIETGDKYYQDRRRRLLALRPQRRHAQGQGGAGSRRWRWSPRSSSMPAVLQAAVVGHKDAEGLVKAKAYVVLKDPSARVGRPGRGADARSRASGSPPTSARAGSSSRPISP